MDFNWRNSKNAIQAQWIALRKQEQKLLEETTFHQQSHVQTNLNSLTTSVAIEEINSQQSLCQVQQQQWDLFQNKCQKLIAETNYPQQTQLGSLTSPITIPGKCAQRFAQFMSYQKRKPQDNNIQYWREFVAEFFTPDGKNRWCLSSYGDSNETRGVFAQKWHCEVCHHKPTRGFETIGEALPRLYKTKYESVLEEVFYHDLPQEFHNSSGQIVLFYDKVIEFTTFEKVRVLREGQLRIVFTPNIKICSWEFCVHRHEESISKNAIVPLVGAVAQTYQKSARMAMLDSYIPVLPSDCNRFVGSATKLHKSLEVPMLNELGYTTKYMRCLQMSEVIHKMKALMNYNREIGMGPLDIYSKISNKNLPTLRKNINNNEQLENNNAGIAEVDVPKGNSSANECVTIGMPQQNSLDPDNGILARNPSGLNDMSSHGNNSSPENGADNNKLANISVIANENQAMILGTASELNEALAPKVDDLDNLGEDFDGKFMSENDLENVIDNFDWSC